MQKVMATLSHNLISSASYIDRKTKKGEDRKTHILNNVRINVQLLKAIRECYILSHYSEFMYFSIVYAAA